MKINPALMFLILLLILSSSCVKCPDQIVYITDSENNIHQVVTIDGCEYFKCRTHLGWTVLSHKGNCKNPVHIYKE